MEKLNISAVSKLLNISKETLRYYENLNLVSPSRGTNGYRSYDEKDILQLQYIQVLKYSGFTLEEIRIILENKNSDEDCELSIENTNMIFENKIEDLEEKIIHFQSIIKLLKQVKKIQETKEIGDKKVLDDLCVEIFKKIVKE